jgi:hypothetical protein
VNTRPQRRCAGLPFLDKTGTQNEISPTDPIAMCVATSALKAHHMVKLSGPLPPPVASTGSS